MSAKRQAGNLDDLKNQDPPPTKKPREATITVRSDGNQITNTEDAPPEMRQIADTTETNKETQIGNTKDAPPEMRQIAAPTETKHETEVANTKDAPPEMRQIAATTETKHETEVANTKDAPPEMRQIAATNETEIANTKDAPPEMRQIADTTETNKETQIGNNKDAPPEMRQIAAPTETKHETEVANTKDAPPEMRQIAATTETKHETEVANTKDSPPEMRQIADTTETNKETQIGNTKDAPPEMRQIAATTEAKHETEIANTKDSSPESRQNATTTETSNETQISNSIDPTTKKSKIATSDKTSKENQIANTKGLDGYTCSSGILKACIAVFESSIDSESDEEFYNNALRIRKKIKRNTIDLIKEISILAENDSRNYVKNYLDEVLPTYTELEFRRHFRISLSLYKRLCESYATSYLYKSVRADKRFSAKLYLAVFLWFAGHKACSFRDLADRFDISLNMISDIMQRVTSYINSLKPKIIKWPSTERKLETSRYFGDSYGFPKAIGCIGLTRIIIDPYERSSDEYYDEDGETSICIQGICDEKKKFIHFNVGYPGSGEADDVFENSTVSKSIASICEEYYLLAGSAYPCSSHCITPYRDNGYLTNAQESFNDKHCKGLVKIEHTFGILKQRFRQLYYCKITGALNQTRFIGACCVLHNMANESDLYFKMESVSQDTDEYIDDDFYYFDAEENAIRDAILIDMEVQP